ncbi:MAG: alpha/beta hydrolase family protein [Clostridia bacterium]|nr:alpha/beta hydrolase family protein [Clostridia bacterium]
MAIFSPDICHEYILSNQKPLLAFDPDAEYDVWKKQVQEKFTELLGDTPEKVGLNITVEWEKESDTFVERRIIFDTEPMASVPCHLLLPKNGKKPYPVVICLQGHSTGMHISLGRAQYEGDENAIKAGDRDFALQIVREGYAALVLEQRGFGERKCNRDKFLWKQTTCEHPAMVALLMGRTILRERAWDVSRAIDMLETIPEIDKERIGLMGNSGGGTVTYYTACLDPRIKVAMPSCSVCSFESSIIMRRHCDCNYVPQMAKYMDMGEMACMIAPRPLVVVAGAKDEGFLLEGVQKVYRVIEQIYQKAGAPENCKLIIGAEGHRFYSKPSWEVFRKYFV